MRLTYLVFAVIFAIGVFFLVMTFLGDDPKPQANLVAEPKVIVKEAPTKEVWVARVPISVGGVLDRTQLDRKPWPKHLVGPNFATVSGGGDAPNILGMVARGPFQPGEVIMINKLANPEDPGFLAAQLPKGMRAVTISTDPVAGLAGFLYPGDRVDVLFSHSLLAEEKRRQLEDAGEKVSRRDEKRITEIILPDIRVLAVNQKAVITGKEKERDLIPSSITLEVEQKDAQRLRLAEREGELSLVLRSLHDDVASYVRPSAEEDLTRTLPPGYFPELYGFDEEYTPEQVVAKKQEEKKKSDLVVVVRGVEVEEIEFESNE